MKRSKKSMRTFLPDTNLFVSALKHPEKKPYSLDLLLELINNKDIILVGNKYLVREMEKYHEKLKSPTARELLLGLKKKVKMVDVDRDSILVCKTYFPKSELSDIIHAATCIKEDSVLITNDKHFDKINNEGLIEVWSITKAIKELIPK
ncbi:MAG: type II toxin-antitoxin system VapC family toxin [Candidatus Hydrothermarchaeales archaeon]